MPGPIGSFGVIGVPTSAGSHNAGQELAPAAWRAGGFLDDLQRAGAVVADRGDLAIERHRPTQRGRGVRNLDRVLGVCRDAADEVEQAAAAGQIPLVLGGDCTLTLGVVAGLNRSGPVGLLYFDGDADLNTPERSGSGILDTMGMTHLLGGGVPELAHLGPDAALLADRRVELFGFDPAELDEDQWLTLTSRRLSATPAPMVRVDPSGAAATAWDRLAGEVPRIVLHVDVDVLDTGAFPLANFPHFNGLTLDEVRQSLEVFGHRPELAAIVITEVNPTHDPDGSLLRQLSEVIVGALT